VHAALRLAIDAQIAPFLVVLVLGFVVGTMGHIVKSRTTIAIGIALIFIATVLLPLLLLSHEKPAP